MSDKLTEVADASEEERADVRREVTNFIRKIIAGAFDAKTYDYFRASPPQREDHRHFDPVSLACTVTDRARTLTVLVTINKLGLEMPAGLAKIWENKKRSSMQSEKQPANNIESRDPSERADARELVRAIMDERKPQGHGGSTTADEASKRRRKVMIRMITEEKY